MIAALTLRRPTELRPLRPALVGLLAALLIASALGGAARPIAPPAAARPPASPQLPLQFVMDSGQAGPGVSWAAQGPSGGLGFTPAGLTLALPAAELRLSFVGASSQATIVAEGPSSGAVSYYLGANPAAWRVGVLSYAGIRYRQLYPGIDLRYDGHDGALKGTYLLDAGASPGQIRWRYSGVGGVSVDPRSGDLLFAVPGAAEPLRERAPVAWQTIGARQVPVGIGYSLAPDGAISFALGAYDRSQPLTIDPTIAYGTYLSGASDDYASAIAVDRAGNMIITGETYAASFPGRTGILARTNLFVSKISPAGSALVYSTVIGGGESDEGLGVAVDTAGNAWVTGSSWSADFPAVRPIQAGPGGGKETVVIKLSPTGQLLLSSYLGEEQNDQGNAIALDPQGNAYIAGTASGQFGDVAFVRKLAAAGTGQLYAAFFGAAERGFDQGTSGQALTVDAAGRAYIVGETNTVSFEGVNGLFNRCISFDGDDCTRSDAYLAIINAAGDRLDYATILGGTEGDQARAVALGPDGSIYLAGDTFSADFPLKRPAQPAKRGLDNFSDIFVARIAPGGDALIYSTYLGGEAWEEGRSIAVDKDSSVYVAGLTSSEDFPLKGALQGGISGICFVGSNERYCYDGVIAKLSPAGGLAWSSYLGGSDDDLINGLALDTAGGVYIAGKTESFGMPTTPGSIQPAKGRQSDAFVLKIGGASSGGDGSRPFRIALPAVIR